MWAERNLYTQGKEPEIEAKFPVIKSFENLNIEELLKNHKKILRICPFHIKIL